MTLGVDTNVLVRYLLGDDRRQAEAARAAIMDALAAEAPLLVSLITLIETEWVLRSRAALSKGEVLTVFKQLLEARDIAFEDESVVERAIYMFEKSRADFPECLMAAQYQRLGCEAMLTFDAQAAKLPGGRLLASQ